MDCIAILSSKVYKIRKCPQIRPYGKPERGSDVRRHYSPPPALPLSWTLGVSCL